VGVSVLRSEEEAQPASNTAARAGMSRVFMDQSLPEPWRRSILWLDAGAADHPPAVAAGPACREMQKNGARRRRIQVAEKLGGVLRTPRRTATAIRGNLGELEHWLQQIPEAPSA
jgi:hypothetical protein